MKSTVRVMIGIVFLTLAIIQPLPAQDGRVVVQGGVFDSSGRVMLGADVFLRDLNSGLEIHQVTDNKGRFQFLVERGHYQATAAMSGFDSTTQDLDLAQTGPVDLRLQLSPAHHWTLRSWSSPVPGSRS